MLHWKKLKHSAYSYRKLHWQYYSWQMGWVLRKLSWTRSVGIDLMWHERSSTASFPSTAWTKYWSLKQQHLRLPFKIFAQAGDVSVPVPRCPFSLIIHPCVKPQSCILLYLLLSSDFTFLLRVLQPVVGVTFLDENSRIENRSEFNLPITGRKD